MIYSATKGALDAVTRVLAAELGPKKIRVNTLAPGMIETEGTHAAGFIGSDFQKKQAEATTPLGRIGQPDDVARVALFLASDEFGLGDGRTHHRGGRQSAVMSRGRAGFVATGQKPGKSVRRQRQR